jgi:hypothetical protein
MIRLAKSVKCKWITWVGDDDLISISYLNVILDVISKDDSQIQSIYPGCNVITEKEFFKLANHNIYEKKLKLTFNKKSLNKIEDIVYRGHQLTGLVYRYNVIEDSFNVLPEDNLYPWICFQSIAIRKGIVISVSGSSIKVTGDTQKLFSYRKDGLLPEISTAVISGFHPNKKLGLQLGTKILKDYAYGRMFKTSKTGIGALFNFIFSFYKYKNQKIVFFKILPSIIKKCLYFTLVHQLPYLHKKIKKIKIYLG